MSDTEAAPEHREASWLPLALAGGVLLASLLVAAFTFATHRHGDPSRARTVDDVAQLSVEAISEKDVTEGDKLSCDETARPLKDLIARLPEGDVKAKITKETGDSRGSFTLTISGASTATVDVVVDTANGRSCVRSLTSTT